MMQDCIILAIVIDLLRIVIALFITDSISALGNAIASVRPSVLLSVRLFPRY